MACYRAIFLDLNGTIILPLKPESLEEMTLIPGADRAIRRLLAAGFLCPIVTVQSRIQKGVYTERDFRQWFAGFFGRLEIDVKGPYVCPHRYKQPCPCKKPQTLLYERAAREWSVDPSRSYVIGDSPEDMEAACRFGGTGCLVETGWSGQEELRGKAQRSAAYVGRDITDAADWILSREQQLDIAGSSKRTGFESF